MPGGPLPTISKVSSSPTGGWALREAFRGGYGGRDFAADLYAGLSVAIVALPLTMAFAIASGVQPQYGLYTAIVAAGIIPLLGGSRVVVTGATAAFVAVLIPISTQYGVAGLLTASLMAGAIMVLMGLSHMGKLIQFIPYPVTTGFTAGIAVVIAALQISDLLGLQLSGSSIRFLGKLMIIAQALPTVSWRDGVIGAFALAVLIGFPFITRRIPAPLVATALAASLAFGLGWSGESGAVRTIGNVYHYDTAGRSYRGIAPVPPHPVLPWNRTDSAQATAPLTLETVRDLIGPALTIAMLGAIVSLLCAVVADGMTGTRHDPDRELIALGVGNMVGAFFGCIPASGAIARTTANIRAGARSPIAATMHSLIILALMLAAAPLLSALPLAALAAVLVMIAWTMFDGRRILKIIRVAPRSDTAVLLTCFGLTVVFDMVISVATGVVLAALLFMRRMSETTTTTLVREEHSLVSGAVPPGVLIYEIAGPLFFGATEGAMNAIQNAAFSQRPKTVILLMENVPIMDVTALVAMESVLDKLRKAKIFVILAGVQKQPLKLLTKAGVQSITGKLAFCYDLEQALMLATLGGQFSAASNPKIPTGNL
ncbi:C4-dicarboxylic acid transporter DauA [soil metagenome]